MTPEQMTELAHCVLRTVDQLREDIQGIVGRPHPEVDRPPLAIGLNSMAQGEGSIAIGHRAIAMHGMVVIDLAWLQDELARSRTSIIIIEPPQSN